MRVLSEPGKEGYEDEQDRVSCLMSEIQCLV